MDDYSGDQMNLRQQALLVLFKHFGNGDFSNQSIYECAQDWVSQGNMNTAGIVKYYEAYYAKSN